MRNGSRATPEFEQGQQTQTVLFEIANGNARQACSLKTKFPTQHQRQNWTRIEQIARDCLARECFEDGRINLVMI